jgi:hypothetical protein
MAAPFGRWDFFPVAHNGKPAENYLACDNAPADHRPETDGVVAGFPDLVFFGPHGEGALSN